MLPVRTHQNHLHAGLSKRGKLQPKVDVWVDPSGEALVWMGATAGCGVPAPAAAAAAGDAPAALPVAGAVGATLEDGDGPTAVMPCGVMAKAWLPMLNWKPAGEAVGAAAAGVADAAGVGAEICIVAAVGAGDAAEAATADDAAAGTCVCAAAVVGVAVASAAGPAAGAAAVVPAMGPPVGTNAMVWPPVVMANGCTSPLGDAACCRRRCGSMCAAAVLTGDVRMQPLEAAASVSVQAGPSALLCAKRTAPASEMHTQATARAPPSSRHLRQAQPLLMKIKCCRIPKCASGQQLSQKFQHTHNEI